MELTLCQILFSILQTLDESSKFFDYGSKFYNDYALNATSTKLSNACRIFIQQIINEISRKQESLDDIILIRTRVKIHDLEIHEAISEENQIELAKLIKFRLSHIISIYLDILNYANLPDGTEKLLSCHVQLFQGHLSSFNKMR